MTATKEQLQTWLCEAESAKHQLVTGKKTVTVSYNGRSVTYSQTQDDLKNLNSYISELKSRLGCGRPRARSVEF